MNKHAQPNFMHDSCVYVLLGLCDHTLTIREWKSSGSALYLVNRAVLNHGSGILHFWRQQYPSNTYTLDIDKWSRKTVWTVSIDKPVPWSILSVPIIRFSSTTWWTFWTVSSGPCVILRPEWCSSLTFPLPLLNSHSPDVTVAWLGTGSPYTFDKRVWNFVVVSPSCERNRITALYPTQSILTKWQTLVCLLK